MPGESESALAMIVTTWSEDAISGTAMIAPRARGPWRSTSQLTSTPDTAMSHSRNSTSPQMRSGRTGSRSVAGGSRNNAVTSTATTRPPTIDAG